MWHSLRSRCRICSNSTLGCWGLLGSSQPQGPSSKNISKNEIEWVDFMGFSIVYHAFWCFGRRMEVGWFWESWAFQIQTCKKWFRDVPVGYFWGSAAWIFSVSLLRLEVQGKEHDRKLEVESAAFKFLRGSMISSIRRWVCIWVWVKTDEHLWSCSIRNKNDLKSQVQFGSLGGFRMFPRVVLV